MRDDIHIFTHSSLSCIFLQSLIDLRNGSMFFTTFDDSTGWFYIIEFTEVVQKLHNCADAKQFCLSRTEKILECHPQDQHLVLKHCRFQSDATLARPALHPNPGNHHLLRATSDLQWGSPWGCVHLLGWTLHGTGGVETWVAMFSHSPQKTWVLLKVPLQESGDDGAPPPLCRWVELISLLE